MTSITVQKRPVIPILSSILERPKHPLDHQRHHESGRRNDSSSPISCQLLWRGLEVPSVALLLICCDFSLKSYFLFNDEERSFDL
jgi:hypothetical protein